MRDIKFRQAIFKDGKFDRFHYWGYVGHKEEFIGPINISGINLPYDVRGSDQFIDKKDYNDNDLWENDIIKDVDGDILLVTWNRLRVRFSLKHEDGSMFGYHFGSIDKGAPFHRIGNIHEDKELFRGV